VGHDGWPSCLLCPLLLAQPPWATAVGPATVVAHGSRHGARQMVVKFEKFSNGCILLHND
jgi:hypothetical protein